VNEILSDDEVEMIEPQIADSESNLIPVGGVDPKAAIRVDNSQEHDVECNNLEQVENSICDSPTTQKEIINYVFGNSESKDKPSKDAENSEDFALETFVSRDDFDLPNPATEKVASSSESLQSTSKDLPEKESPDPKANFAPKISIRSPDNLNGEFSKFYSSISAPPVSVVEPEVQTPGVELRFLPDMVIRVMDNSTVKEIAGKPGKIVSVRSGGEKATVKLEGLSGARIVQVAEVEVELPEEGDQVKSLIWGSPSEVGDVISLDDDDNAVVKFREEQRVIQIDLLCKVDVG